jgi:hypothetical protein
MGVVSFMAEVDSMFRTPDELLGGGMNNTSRVKVRGLSWERVTLCHVTIRA